ncbi:MAG: family 78 glycoside hydrolase catalytic domain [Candidatus Latescibacter sp.]|nr:family 78 glycoside hydrolase catalytic domain [Candidatus Latescibacter sp.]
MTRHVVFPALLLTFFYTAACQGYGAIKSADLRCEYLTNPLGIDASNPRLSWILGSSERGEIQTAYQILVASDRKNLDKNSGDLWDSGKVSSDQSTLVPYAGKPLKSGMACFWKIRAWDKNGIPSPYSMPAFWSMGLLLPSDWHAQWISKIQKPTDPPKKGETAKPGPPAPYFRKTFDTGKKSVRRAMLYISARGMFEAHINGKRVGKDMLAPEYTDYSKRIQYRAYDITGMLRPGKNAIGAIVGDGWYSGYIGGIMIRNYYGVQNGLLAELRLELSDGSEQTVATDASWKCSLGPILDSDMLLGETYDARKEIPGWDGPAFDDSVWENASVMDKTDAPLVAQHAEPVQVVKELRPVKMTEPKPGEFVFDMGQNFAGWARLKVMGPSGTTVTMRFAEMLNPDGSLYTANLRRARSIDRYTLRGGGQEMYEPHFTFHGFRYVEITGYPGKPALDALTGCVITSTTPQIGTFDCSNPMVNKLVSNILWGQMSNFISIPTDCPQRDERQGWMGDAQIFIRTATYNADAAAFITKWMQDVADEQTPQGAFTDTCPFIKGLGGDGAPGWGDAGIIVPWTFYQVYGDKKIIGDHYRSMARWMDYLQGGNPNYLRKNLLNNNYGDWLSIKANTPKDLLATAYWAYDARLMSRMARVIDNDSDAARYEDLFRKIRAAFQKEYLSPEGRIRGETQTGYLLALYMDLLPEELRVKAAQYLVEDIRSKGWHLSTGFIGVRHLAPVLTRMGYPDVAYRLLNNDTFPSWGYSIKQGATTIWERWDGWTEDKGFQDPGMNSFNHYSLGSVGEWLYSSVAGIDLDPEKPGFKHIIIRPVPGGGLTYARARYQSIHGLIQSSWTKSLNQLSLLQKSRLFDTALLLSFGHPSPGGGRNRLLSNDFPCPPTGEKRLRDRGLLLKNSFSF